MFGWPQLGLILPLRFPSWSGYILGSGDELNLFLVQAATQLVHQVQQERTQVVCSNKVARKRRARRHPRNGPWNELKTHTRVVE